MYEATRHFIEARQPYCKNKLKYIENVERVAGGIATKCFDNALALYRTKRDSRFVSGWVVNKHDPHNNLTAILQHWWVQDMTGKCYDSTPNMNEDYDYVQDMDIYWYGQDNFKDILSQVTMNLMYKANTYWLVEQVEPEFIAHPIVDLKTEIFFKFEN
jgi:hypothetical protein